MVDRGWAEEFASFGQLCRKHGGDAETSPLSKLGLISKQRNDGSWKHRLVWDLRRSGINEALQQGQRIVLPRVIDVVRDCRDLKHLG
eukprot:1781915-Amphidinium_carterae.1